MTLEAAAESITLTIGYNYRQKYKLILSFQIGGYYMSDAAMSSVT